MSVSSRKLFCDFRCTGSKAHILSWPTKPLYDYVSLCLSPELIPPCPLFQPRWSHFGSLKVQWPFQPQNLSEILSPFPTFNPLHMHAHFGFFSLGFRLNVTTPEKSFWPPYSAVCLPLYYSPLKHPVYFDSSNSHNLSLFYRIAYLMSRIWVYLLHDHICSPSTLLDIRQVHWYLLEEKVKLVNLFALRLLTDLSQKSKRHSQIPSFLNEDSNTNTHSVIDYWSEKTLP